MCKRTLQIVLGIFLVAQWAGCFYSDGRWHHAHGMYHGHPEDRSAGVDGHVHG